MASKRSEHLRYRYGICLNENCSKCKSKEVQQIAARKDFVCAECQKPLRECPPPKTFWDKYGKLIIGICVVVVAAAIIVPIALNNSKKDAATPSKPKPERTTAGSKVHTKIDDKVKVDSTSLTKEPKEDIAETKEKVETKEVKDSNVGKVKKEPVAESPKSSIRVPFGKYSGPASGLDGEIVVTKAYSLDLRNAAGESLELLPGDVITKTKFKNGELVSGFWKRGGQGRSFHR